MFTHQIIRDYHFYAAHRNENLDDKCKFLHGHTYTVKVELDFLASDKKLDGTFLNFGEIDNFVCPIIADLDHSTIVSEKDSRLEHCVLLYPDIFGKIVVLPDATSVENLCLYIGSQINKTKLHGRLKSVAIKETTTSEVKINF